MPQMLLPHFVVKDGQPLSKAECYPTATEAVDAARVRAEQELGTYHVYSPVTGFVSSAEITVKPLEIVK